MKLQEIKNRINEVDSDENWTVWKRQKNPAGLVEIDTYKNSDAAKKVVTVLNSVSQSSISGNTYIMKPSENDYSEKPKFKSRVPYVPVNGSRL